MGYSVYYYRYNLDFRKPEIVKYIYSIWRYFICVKVKGINHMKYMLVCIDSISNPLKQCDVNGICSLSLVSKLSFKQTNMPNLNVPVQYVYVK